jgi:8-oxo-dGTP pyrophosphatase MutT (NUDIX family)
VSQPVKLIFQDYLGQAVEYDGISPIHWRVTVYALVRRDNQILMAQPVFAPRWELPGGAVEPGETLLEGVARECWEETGYHFTTSSFQPLSLTEAFYFERSTATYYHALITVLEGTVEPEVDPDWNRPAEEIAQVAWIEPATLHLDNTYQHQREALRRIGVIL